mgnify:CR=1 FL=1
MTPASVEYDSDYEINSRLKRRLGHPNYTGILIIGIWASVGLNFVQHFYFVSLLKGKFLRLFAIRVWGLIPLLHTVP